MPKHSSAGVGTPLGAQILDDFKNWKTTGFKPWGKAVGNVNHYRSRQMYQEVKHATFQRQAKVIAKIALEQLPATKIHDDDDAASFHIDSEKKNPWVQQTLNNISNNKWGDEKDPCQNKVSDNKFFKESEESDADFESCESDDDSEDCLDDFDKIQPAELQNSFSALLSEYPCGSKLLVVFPLDRNVWDVNSNQFEFVDDNTAIVRWSKVPEERLDAKKLIGIGTEATQFGFSDADLMILDVEIKKRLKENKCKTDENGDMWEVREKLMLPFQCCEKLFDRKGNELVNFRTRTNGKGFSWAFFWLRAWTPKPKRSKRIGATMVTTMGKDDSSLYSEKTVFTTRSKRTKK